VNICSITAAVFWDSVWISIAVTDENLLTGDEISTKEIEDEETQKVKTRTEKFKK
jgi:hypothetical protein